MLILLSCHKKSGFTLIELVTAVAIFAMVIAFTGIIFNVSIESYRVANAEAEIMQKMRAITDQLNRDFSGLCKDGFLLLYSRVLPDKRLEYKNSTQSIFVRADRLYYFSAGDYQSWFDPNRSNIARISFGSTAIRLRPVN